MLTIYLHFTAEEALVLSYDNRQLSQSRSFSDSEIYAQRLVRTFCIYISLPYALNFRLFDLNICHSDFFQADSCAFSQSPPTKIPIPEGNSTVGDYNDDDDEEEEEEREEEKDEGKCAFYFNTNNHI